MKIKIVTYNKKYVTGPYLNHQIGFEAEVGEREDPMDVLEELKCMADAFNSKTNKFDETLVVPEIPTKWVDPHNLPEDQRIAALIADINTCSDVKILETYKFIAKQNPQLTEAYELKMKELTQ